MSILQLPRYLQPTSPFAPITDILRENLVRLINPLPNDWLLVAPYSAGDTYHLLTLLDAFRSYYCQSGQRIIVIADSAHREICEYFPNTALFAFIDGLKSYQNYWQAICSNQSFAPGQIISSGVEHIGDGRMCQLAFLRNISIVDIMKYGLRLPFDARSKKPSIPPHLMERSLRIAADVGMIKGKSVIMVNHAKTLRPVSVEFWSNLSLRIQDLGYTVFQDISVECPVIEGARPIKFTFGEMAGIAEFAGHVVAQKSGIPDILCGFNTDIVTIFPGVQNYTNNMETPYSFYSTLNAGLTDFEYVVDMSIFPSFENAIDMIISDKFLPQ